jgi:DNA-directed RNA polymerase subunit L
MNKVGKINIKQKSYDNSPMSSRLELNIKGNDIDQVVVNTIRRVCLTDIPIYIYNKFHFVENTSIFNNNYIKLRLRNIPVIGIYSDTPFYKSDIGDDNNDDNYIENLMNIDDINLKTEYNLESTNLKQFTLYLDYQNKTNNIVTVGTDDCKFYYQEKEIKTPYKINIPIIKLQANQSIKLTVISEIGIEKMDALYSPVSVLYFTKNNNTDYDLISESRGQLEEYKILEYGIENILNQLDILKNDINKKKLPDTKKNTIIFDNNNHTMGNLLSHGMRKNNKIIFAGYNMPHILDDKIEIKFELKSDNITNILNEVIDYYKDLFNNIKNNLNK